MRLLTLSSPCQGLVIGVPACYAERMAASSTTETESAMPAMPKPVAVPNITITVTSTQRYLVRCAECGPVEAMWTKLGAADMRAWHRRCHLANSGLSRV